MTRVKKEGTLYKRANGTWRAQISLQGQRLSFTSKSQAECRTWLRETHQRILAGFTYSSSKLSYSEFLEGWLVTVQARLRRGTFKQYSQVVNHYVLPELGNVKLGDLQPIRIQRLYDKLIASGKGSRTVQMVHAVIHRSLNQAVKLGIISLNPDDATSPPKPQEKEMSVLDQEQVQRLLIEAKRKSFREFVFYFFVLATGVRQGELLGLKWEDFDAGKKTVRITRQAKPLPGGGFEFVVPKTKNGFRTIKLGDETVDLLNKHFVLQLDERSAARKWEEYGLIFPSVVGTPLNPPNVVREFRSLLKRAGLPKIRFHDLRHTAASLMLNNGVDVLVVSRRLGHSKASITLDVYGHLIPSGQEKVAHLIENLISPISVSAASLTAPDLHPILSREV
ncbi:MAG: site-specific integrase [Anaerolineales bacterium]|nr:site-specific integrase [Anaerolineales bacterium]